MSDRTGLRPLAVRQGFKPSCTLPNGVAIYRLQFADQHVSWRAFRGDTEVAALGVNARDKIVSGHVAGDFSRCQGQDADCATYTPWRAAVAALDQESP